MVNRITEEDFERALMRMERRVCPTAIKVTDEFLAYLEAKCKPDIVFFNSAQGYAEKFMGIPVYVDNTINHPYYEFVFEEC
jgi:nitrogenase molybdenum-iron protein alpha/beta subunit